MPAKAAADVLSEDLLPDVRLALRLTGGDFDTEVATLIGAAAEDMLRVGVSEGRLLDEGPLVRAAVTCFCKARFGFDSEDAPRFESCYRQHVVDMLNSDMNSAAAR